MLKLGGKRKLAVGITALCLCFFILGAAFVYATTPSTTFTISSGIYPGAETYTFYSVSGTYYMKSQYGPNAYSGTNATDVFSDAITYGLSIADGVTIKVTVGRVPFATAIAISQTNASKQLTIIGSGKDGGTTFYTSAAINLFDLTDNIMPITFKDIRLSGYSSGTTKTGLSGLYNAGVGDFNFGITLENVHILGFTVAGINAPGDRFADLKIFNTDIQDCATGIVSPHYFQMHAGTITDCTYAIDAAYEGNSFKFFGTLFSENDYILASSVTGVGTLRMDYLFDGCWFEGYTDFLNLTNAATSVHATLKSCTIANDAVSSTYLLNWAVGSLTVEDCTIENLEAGPTLINVGEYCEYYFKHNRYMYTPFQPVQYTIHALARGQLVDKWYSRSFSVAGTSPITVTHGLKDPTTGNDAGPSYVLISQVGDANGSNMTAYGTDATNIYIYFDGGGTRTFTIKAWMRGEG